MRHGTHKQRTHAAAVHAACLFSTFCGSSELLRLRRPRASVNGTGNNMGKAPAAPSGLWTFNGQRALVGGSPLRDVVLFVSLGTLANLLYGDKAEIRTGNFGALLQTSRMSGGKSQLYTISKIEGKVFLRQTFHGAQCNSPARPKYFRVQNGIN